MDIKACTSTTDFPAGLSSSSTRADYCLTGDPSAQAREGDVMSFLGGEALQKIRSGELVLGFGVHQLRGAAVPMLAKAAGYDWLFIDAEHGVISAHDISQI